MNIPLHSPYILRIGFSFGKSYNLKFIRLSSSQWVYENSMRYFCEGHSQLQFWSWTAKNAYVGLEEVGVVLIISQKIAFGKFELFPAVSRKIFPAFLIGLIKGLWQLTAFYVMAGLTLYELILFQKRWVIYITTSYK